MSPEEFPLLAATISFAGLVGVFVGSFLNVVVYRAPLGLSVSSPRSVLSHMSTPADLVGERSCCLLAGPQGQMPDLPRSDLSPISIGRAVHRGRVRPGHLGLARHYRVCRLLLSCRHDDRRRADRIRRKALPPVRGCTGHGDRTVDHRDRGRCPGTMANRRWIARRYLDCGDRVRGTPIGRPGMP